MSHNVAPEVSSTSTLANVPTSPSLSAHKEPLNWWTRRASAPARKLYTQSAMKATLWTPTSACARSRPFRHAPTTPTSSRQMPSASEWTSPPAPKVSLKWAASVWGRLGASAWQANWLMITASARTHTPQSAQVVALSTPMESAHVKVSFTSSNSAL